MTKNNLLNTLGPGIIFASMAIGVSHLVQSTQAGGNYGFGLLWAILLANIFKYPFFEYGARYANATGTSLIDGYKKLHPLILWLYLALTIASMFFITAAVCEVTIGFMQNLFGIQSTLLAASILFTLCATILISGKYRALDSVIKIIGIVLLVSTLIVFILTLIKGPLGTKNMFHDGFLPSNSNLIFLFALMGWMPTALDVSTWSSLWTIERIKQTRYKPSMREALFDFNLGYIVCVILAVCFVTMGAFVFYGTETVIAKNATQFANQVVNLYTTTTGDWAYIFIAIAAFSIMFSTSLTVFDGYARAIKHTTKLLFNPPHKTKNNQTAKYTSNGNAIALLVIMTGAALILIHYNDNPNGFNALISFATTLSFLIAPIIAILNFTLVQKKYLGVNAPPRWLQILSVLGIIFLISFSILFLIYTILN